MSIVAAAMEQVTPPAFVSAATTERAQNTVARKHPKFRIAGSGKRRPLHVMRPTLRQLQVSIRRNKRALALAKEGSPLAKDLQAQQKNIANYLNAATAPVPHGKQL